MPDTTALRTFINNYNSNKINPQSDFNNKPVNISLSSPLMSYVNEYRSKAENQNQLQAKSIKLPPVILQNDTVSVNDNIIEKEPKQSFFQKNKYKLLSSLLLIIPIIYALTKKINPPELKIKTVVDDTITQAKEIVEEMYSNAWMLTIEELKVLKHHASEEELPKVLFWICAKLEKHKNFLEIIKEIEPVVDKTLQKITLQSYEQHFLDYLKVAYIKLGMAEKALELDNKMNIFKP